VWGQYQNLRRITENINREVAAVMFDDAVKESSCNPEPPEKQ